VKSLEALSLMGRSRSGSLPDCKSGAKAWGFESLSAHLQYIASVVERLHTSLQNLAYQFDSGRMLAEKELMRMCWECGNKTNNPKFCSRSCAATYNNKAYPKRSYSGSTCRCGKQIRNSNSCLVCSIED
jgi:hypothetical protein